VIVIAIALVLAQDGMRQIHARLQLACVLDSEVIKLKCALVDVLEWGGGPCPTMSVS